MTRTALLIEDNEQNRYLATFLLERHGYRVVAAADGRAALSALQGFTPDVVLLDIQLPGMDGYEVARRLRELDSLQATPIIAVTSYAMLGDREKSLAAGCNGYIEKPIDPETFIREIEQVLVVTTEAPR
jgi:two-component system, cell cycle response regulator DivK